MSPVLLTQVKRPYIFFAARFLVFFAALRFGAAFLAALRLVAFLAVFFVAFFSSLRFVVFLAALRFVAFFFVAFLFVTFLVMTLFAFAARERERQYDDANGPHGVPSSDRPIELSRAARDSTASAIAAR